MPAVENVLVVGGGAAGTATAILLAQAGVTVDLVDVKPEPTAIGSGITLQGNALRVLKQLGVWDDVSAAGYAFDSLGLRAPDPAGTLLAEIPDVKTGGPGLPATLGMPRPELARILLERTLSAGAKVRFGTTFTDLTQDAGSVQVTFSDGSSGTVRPRHRRRRHPFLDPTRPRRPPRDARDRDGHLARLRAAARQRHPHRPLLRRPVATSPGTAPPARTRSTRTSSSPPRTARR